MSTLTAPTPPATRSRAPASWLRAAAGYVGLALLAYVPVFRSSPGRVAADTKQYLYLDPGRMLGRAVTMWDPNIGMGTVTHQNIGYLFPMGPFSWVFDAIGVPDWVAQRIWLGSLLLAAAVGVLYLLRTFGLRGPGIVIAAIAYMFTPYVLDYSARISVILMPWAALPWLIGFVRKGLRDGGWRYPALFAIVVQLVGGVNATALLFAGLGPALWIVYSWLVEREVQWRRALSVAGRTFVLTLVTSLWWIAGLSIQGGYGLDVLKYTETVEAVARTSTPNEVLRGLGYWFFYGQDRLGPWIEASTNYTQKPLVIFAGYALVALALLSAGFVRWRHRLFFVGLLLVGVVIAVGANPYDEPTPLGAVFKAFATGSTAGLAMRSTARAVPLVVLATAVLLGVGTNAVYNALRRHSQPILAVGVVAVVVALIFVNFPAVVDGTFYGKNLDRAENIPQYWYDAAHYLDAQGNATRVFEAPGIDFASYRWGNTVDPVTPGIMDRPYVARELIPWGSPASADLLNAIDRRMQENQLDPAGFAALMRRMGIGDVVLRNDIQNERFDVVAPRELDRAMANIPGLGPAKSFGTPTVPVLARPHQDEYSLRAPANEPPAAPVVVYPVEGAQPIVRAESNANGVILAGDGEGFVDAADVGLLDHAGIVQYAGSYGSRNALRRAIGDDSTLVLTDSNRRRARRWTSVRDNVGVTEAPGEKPLVTDSGDARLGVFPTSGDDARTTMNQQGVQWATASSYGNTITYTPEDAASRAFDGDLTTAWRAAAFGEAIGQRIHLVLDQPITADHVNLVQTLTGPRARFITGVRLTFDGGDAVTSALGDTSRTATGQTISFPSRRFKVLDIEITATNIGKRTIEGNANSVGFSEVRVRDAKTGQPVRVHEVLRMPSDLLSAAGAASLQHPLVILMRRERVIPIPPRHDPELQLSREFVLPTARQFSLTGTARLTSEGPASALATALGTKSVAAGGVQSQASASMAGCVACEAGAAIDGDPATAWQTPFDDVVGQYTDYQLARPITFDHMNLIVRADGRHSLPTQLQLDVDGQARTIAVPPVADRASENATQTIPLRFAPVTGRHVRITISATRPETTFNFYAQGPSTLPVGIAEWGIPGLRAPAPNGALPGACRSDLLRIDGKPVPVRIDGTAATGVAMDGLTVSTCSPTDPAARPALTLGAGSHVVESARGLDTAIQMDRLVLASAAGGGPASVAGGRVLPTTSTASAAPKVEVTRDGRTRMRVHVSGATKPFWLVLGQSDNRGWQASTDGGSLGPRRLVDGYANGWYVQPSKPSFDVVLDWTPQRRVWVALWVSLAALILCIGIGLFTWWKRRAALPLITAPLATDSEVELDWPARGGRTPSPRVWVTVSLLAALAGAVIAAPWIGLVVGVVTAIAMRWRLGRVMLAAAPGVLVGAIGAYIAIDQHRYHIPPVFEWPTAFPRARTIAWIAVLLIAVFVVVDAARHWRERARARGPDASSERSDRFDVRELGEGR